MGIRLPISAAAAALAAWGGLNASPAALAAFIEGQIGFPGQSAPPMTAYVCEVDTSRIRTIPIAPGKNKFAVEVPAGRYIVFLAPREPGAPNIYGAHTLADHALANVNVSAYTARTEISIDDWYLSDEIAAQPDRIRGIETSSAAEPLAAPRFSEYRAGPFEGTTAPKPECTAITLSSEARSRLQQSLPTAPNFAGNFSLLLSHCGNDCDRLFLFDWHNGKVFDPTGPGELRGTLTPATEIQRSMQQFCAA